MPFRIYIAEDETNLNQVLSTYLHKEGWQVRSFLRGEEARKAIPERPHLWILDIMLPDVDGFQLIREIKADSPGMPVIFISARDADLDRVIGLEMGSDDYLAKPFLPRELVIRSRRLLERIYGAPQIETQPAVSTIVIPPYHIDETRRLLYRQDTIIELTSKEFDFVLFLAKHQGTAFAREQLLNHIWGEDYFGTDRVVDDLVRRIRRKLTDLRLETLYGYGYRLVQS
ncbi:response regulator transcription factor [Paenibacillus hemerocallicola]|uniref:Response regulator transcription factor n=1 Tax=Paenibacillus hemerocallicola TaxID=1172614 RepID=A0A5C4SYX3_9BACL|nr:response regulator transcription factor [Paenibacillus hemerocallicola]TNJ61971.1 response regulator transcription factor [Paenibacillus hemerocallicola]